MRNTIKARRSIVCMGRVCYETSLCGPTLLCVPILQWAEFALGRDGQLPLNAAIF